MMQVVLTCPGRWIVAGCLLAPVPACAQAYPVKPVRMILPFATGGASDVVIRIISSRLPELFKQQVVVDNRPGAGGLIGTELAAAAIPDGYTLLATGTPHVILPNLYKNVTFDVLKDFAPIMQIGTQPSGLTVHPSLGVRTVKELIALAQKQPGKLNYASSGNGGAQHLFQAMFASMAKINMVHVPYKGSGQVRSDLLGGQIGIGCMGISSIINNHRAGQVRIIGVTSAKRSPELPDVPTIGETVPGYEAELWIGFLAPRGTPPAVIARVQRDVNTLLREADTKTAFERVGTHVVATEPKAFGELIALEFAKWGKVVREVNAQVN
jgi:tripartite-type tricarboxylate transporter receptor subunit TctC